jgi:prophage tail gpP-like protein
LLIQNISAYDVLEETVILIDGKTYSEMKKCTVTRHVDTVCGTFSLHLPTDKTNPFKIGSVLSIKMGGAQVMRGKVYCLEQVIGPEKDEIVVSGRDITGDLVDSTVPDSCKVFGAGVHILDIAKKIVAERGFEKSIFCYNNAGDVQPFSEDEIITCEVGDTISDFLMRYCRKRQLFLNTDPFGNLIFFRADGVDTGNNIQHLTTSNANNVIERSIKRISHECFNRYICRSQELDAWESLKSVASGGEERDVDTFGEAFDSRPENAGRELEFLLEKGGSSADCTARATEEADVRRSRAFEYSVKVKGYRDIKPWAVNQLVNILDTRADISGKFYICGVEYNYDMNEGKTTRLSISYKDAYVLLAKRLLSIEKAKTNQESFLGNFW